VCIIQAGEVWVNRHFFLCVKKQTQNAQVLHRARGSKMQRTRESYEIKLQTQHNIIMITRWSSAAATSRRLSKCNKVQLWGSRLNHPRRAALVVENEKLEKWFQLLNAARAYSLIVRWKSSNYSVMLLWQTIPHNNRRRFEQFSFICCPSVMRLLLVAKPKYLCRTAQVILIWV